MYRAFNHNRYCVKGISAFKEDIDTAALDEKEKEMNEDFAKREEELKENFAKRMLAAGKPQDEVVESSGLSKLRV